MNNVNKHYLNNVNLPISYLLGHPLTVYFEFILNGIIKLSTPITPQHTPLNPAQANNAYLSYTESKTDSKKRLKTNLIIYNKRHPEETAQVLLKRPFRR